VKAKQHFSEDIWQTSATGKACASEPVPGRTGSSASGLSWSTRVFVRSWNVKPRGWFRTFLGQPRGVVQTAERAIAVRAVRTRDKRLRDVVDRAYLDKCNTCGAIKYARDLGSATSRATTLELRPLTATRR
jgi:hypothetical protein